MASARAAITSGAARSVLPSTPSLARPRRWSGPESQEPAKSRSWYRRPTRRPEAQMIDRDLARVREIVRRVAGSTKQPYEGLVLDRFQLIQEIGDGSYGVVYEAIDRLAPTTRVAVKVFRTKATDDHARQHAAVRFFRGVIAMHELRDARRIVSVVHGPIVTAEFLWFAMEYWPERDVMTWLQEHDADDGELVRVFDDMIEALRAAHTHKKKVVHRDIRPQNVVVRLDGGTYEAALTDFDLAYYDYALGQAGSTTVAPVGNSRYLPTDVKDLKADEQKGRSPPHGQ